MRSSPRLPVGSRKYQALNFEESCNAASRHGQKTWDFDPSFIPPVFKRKKENEHQVTDTTNHVLQTALFSSACQFCQQFRCFASESCTWAWGWCWHGSLCASWTPLSSAELRGSWILTSPWPPQMPSHTPRDRGACVRAALARREAQPNLEGVGMRMADFLDIKRMSTGGFVFFWRGIFCNNRKWRPVCKQ